MRDNVEPLIIKDEINLLSVKEFPSYIPLREVVFQNLKQSILDGTLRPGQLLSENKIASQLSVSRTPVREALRTLEMEGLVTILSGRRIIVSVPSIQDIEDIYDIRLIVEAEAVRRINPEQKDLLEKLETCVRNAENYIENNDLQGLKDNNNEFHHSILLALKNNKMKQIIDSLQDTLSRFRLYALTDKQWAKDSNNEHLQIIERIKNRDYEGAVSILRQHLSKSKETLLTILYPDLK